MERSGATLSLDEFEVTLRRSINVYRRYQRSPCGQLRWRHMLPRDFPELSLWTHTPGTIFTPNERGPQLPALLPRNRGDTWVHLPQLAERYPDLEMR